MCTKPSAIHAMFRFVAVEVEVQMLPHIAQGLRTQIPLFSQFCISKIDVVTPDVFPSSRFYSFSKMLIRNTRCLRRRFRDTLHFICIYADCYKRYMDKKIIEDGITCIFFAFLIVLAKMEVREKIFRLRP
jgi:hypothetical protein